METKNVRLFDAAGCPARGGSSSYSLFNYSTPSRSFQRAGPRDGEINQWPTIGGLTQPRNDHSMNSDDVDEMFLKVRINECMNERKFVGTLIFI